MTARRIFAGSVAILALWAGVIDTADAQWKWRDANGRITISDLPPPRGIPPQDILQRPNPVPISEPAAAASSASAAAPAPPVDPELQARRQEAEQAEAAKQRADEDRIARQRAENCRNARAHLAALDSGQRIARYNAQGEREILDDKQRASEARRARDVIASDCR